MSHGVVDAATLKRMLHDGGEIALLDVREEGVFAKGHMFLAVPAPLSRLEIRVPVLVPRRSTRIVVTDGGEGLAERAAAALAGYGYGRVSVLEGGMQAWIDAGYEVYTGVNVPSKAFGEYVERHDETPRMDPAQVKACVDRGDDMVILDSRPLAEYRKVSIPGAIDCPGAELPYRIHDLVKSDSTLVVVNCGGRTRSIIGAQSLRNAGIPNRVVALKNGTMGWHLAGFPVDSGRTTTAPPPGARGLQKARQAAQRVARRFGIRFLEAAGLDAFLREADTRTVYLLDVRSPEEYASRHLRGSVSAPGGQLVQTTDTYVGVRNARLVLIDDDGVRATMTASWLMQMGWNDVHVLHEAPAYGEWVSEPPAIEVLGLGRIRCATMSPEALAALPADGTSILDLDSKPNYRDGHIPGAWHGIRANLESNLARLPAGRRIVVTSADGVVATLAAPEIAAITGGEVFVLEGGTQAWRAAGHPMEEGETRLTDDTDDVWVKVHDRAGNRDQAMKDYLNWEVDLMTQIERDDDAGFRRYPTVD